MMQGAPGIAARRHLELDTCYQSKCAPGNEMTEAAGTETGTSRFSAIWSAWRDPAVRIRNVDLFAVLIAILLPWSTSGVGIAVVLWLIALVPTIEPRPLLQSLRRPAAVLPIAFVALAMLGTLWSQAPWGVRLYGISPVAKL